MREESMEQLTRDHTLLQELVDRGFYSQEEARESLNKNLVTRAVGVSGTVQVDLLEDIAQVNDIYLLCSDGLSDMIDDDLIADTLMNYKNSLDKTAKELIRQANDHGGKDNVSAVLAKPIKPFPAQSGWLSRIFDLFS